MVNGFKVITLCGSTKFKDDFLAAQKRLTLEGNIVISVGLFGHSGDDEVWTEGTKEMLDSMHKAKILMADEIFVINKGGYIGESTKSEIEFARLAGKKINYLEDIEDNTKKRITLKEFQKAISISGTCLGINRDDHLTVIIVAKSTVGEYQNGVPMIKNQLLSFTGTTLVAVSDALRTHPWAENYQITQINHISTSFASITVESVD